MLVNRLRALYNIQPQRLSNSIVRPHPRLLNLKVVGPVTLIRGCSTDASEQVSIFVGNFPFNTTEQQIASLFEKHGPVGKVRLLIDKYSGRPRGFGFVEMKAPDAQKALQALNGFPLNGRTLRVNLAEKKPRFHSEEQGNQF